MYLYDNKYDKIYIKYNLYDKKAIFWFITELIVVTEMH